MANSIFNDKKLINIDEAYRICLKYKYVSFDIFDTLIKRNLATPLNIFDVLDFYSKDFNIKSIKDLRIKAEQNLRKNKRFITIHDIYDEISKNIGVEKANQIKEIEIKIEMSYCQPNYEIRELLEKLQKAGKNIIAISDMYLPKNILSKILKKNNIFIDEIYVSCDCKAQKKNGSLFKYVLERKKINRKDLIHIGDSFKADIFGSKMARIKCMHISNKLNYYNDKKAKRIIKNKRNYEIFTSVINNNIPLQDGFYKKVGFSIIGPLIYNYCIWLRKKCLKNNIKKVFFFARDGFVIKKVFEKMYKDEFETKYIYLSRRSIRIPYAAIHSSFDEIMKYIPKTHLLTIRVFLENFGINPDNYIDLLRKYDLSLRDVISYKELFEKEKYRKIFDELQGEIIKIAEKELNVLKIYLNQEKFYGKVAIVDIGWHNSIQYYLEEISKHEKLNLELYGMYLGIQPNEKKVSNAESFIRENSTNQYVKSVKSFIGLMESVFLANEGSTLKYKINNGVVNPVLLPYEYSINDIENKGFEEIKKGVFNFVDVVERLEKFDNFNLEGFDSFAPLRIFGINPYLKDIGYFSKFRFYSEEIVYFSNPKTIIHYIFHLNELKNDFFYARWKIGFMKELFKISLPYYTIYQYYKNKKGL